MKTFVKSILFTGALLMGANGLMAGEATNRWVDQWYRAKLGRPSPMEEARQRAEGKDTTLREEAVRETALPSYARSEQWHQAKFGRTSPIEDARLKTERENSAFRAEPVRQATTAGDWREQWYQAKFGRPSPLAEAHQKAEEKPMVAGGTDEQTQKRSPDPVRTDCACPC